MVYASLRLTSRATVFNSPGGPVLPFLPGGPIGPIEPGSPDRPLSPWTPLSPGIPGSPWCPDITQLFMMQWPNSLYLVEFYNITNKATCPAWHKLYHTDYNFKAWLKIQLYHLTCSTRWTIFWGHFHTLVCFLWFKSLDDFVNFFPFFRSFDFFSHWEKSKLQSSFKLRHSLW